METTFTELALLMWAVVASVVASVLFTKLVHKARMFGASTVLHIRMMENPHVYEDIRRHYEREKHDFFRRQHRDATGTEESK